jgi:para-nitrobenzyl esterase
MNPIPGDPITIETGRVSGTLLDSGAHAYFGIPFAAPPVRELRWHAPMPVSNWKGILNASTQRTGCIVAGVLPGPFSGAYADAMGEDCLYLNLWAPATANPRRRVPVIAWIHGGGFAMSMANEPVWGGQEMVKKGVIYLTIEYRTNIFGFLAHPEMTRESGMNGSGNWGLLDQVAALKWVQRNIGAFGGDPANVTIVGESAGSMSVSDLQVSPLAKGLFARVVGMSGTFMPTGGQPHVSLREAEALGLKLQEALKAADLSSMRAISWETVRTTAQQAGIRAWPDIDGHFMPDLPENIFAAKKQTDVPVLSTGTANDLGSNTAMGRVKTLEEYNQLAARQYGAAADEFLKVWPATTDGQAAKQGYEVMTSTGFGIAARDWARRQTLNGKEPAYLGLIARIQPGAPGALNPPATACHACDITYWFGTLDIANRWQPTRAWTSWDRKLSDAMQNVIVAFAKTGNPKTAEVDFPKYDPNNEMRIVFGDTISVQTLNTPGLDFLQTHPIQGGRGGGRGPADGRGGRGPG